jgi:hypothetical protein
MAGWNLHPDEFSGHYLDHVWLWYVVQASKSQVNFEALETSFSVWGLRRLKPMISQIPRTFGILWLTLVLKDASFHLSEECANASIATPRSIIMTAGSGSVMGFILNLVIAYTIQDVAEVIESDLVSLLI